MHILVVGRPRCRTSFLSMAYRDYHNLVNLHEIFSNGTKNLWFKGNTIKDNNRLDKVQKFHIRILENITKEVFSHDRSIIKLFPRDIITHCYPNLKFSNLNDFDYKCITDVSQILQLERYDQILLLERSFIDSAISYIYGQAIGILLFERAGSKTFYEKKIMPVTITEENLHILNFYILEYLVDQNLKKFIEDHYSCKKLDYIEIPNFVKENFNNSKTNHYIDLEIDYKKVIVNYWEVVEYINLKLEEYSSEYQSIKFT